MPTSPAARAVLWTVGLLGAVGAAILVSGPITLALRGILGSEEMGRTFRRTLMVLVLGVLLVLLRPWKDRPPGTWGLHGEAARPMDALAGLVLSLGLLGLLLAWQAIPGWVRWDEAHGASKLASRWKEAAARGLLLGVAEELFFRGWLLARVSRRAKPLAAAVITSAVYAVAHAFKTSAAPKGLSADPAGAVAALSAWLEAAVDYEALAARMVGLFAFGMVLAAAYRRTGSLWLGIGIHAGAIFLFDAMSALTDRTPERNWAGSKWLYDGPPAWVAMGLVAWALWPRRPAGSAAVDPAAGGPP